MNPPGRLAPVSATTWQCRRDSINAFKESGNLSEEGKAVQRFLAKLREKTGLGSSRRLCLSGNFTSQVTVMVKVPRVDPVDACFQGTPTQQGIINCSTGDSCSGGRFNRLPVILNIQRNDLKPFFQRLKKQQYLIGTEPELTGHSSQRGVQLCQSMCRATTAFRVGVGETEETTIVVFVVFQEHRH